MRSADRRTVQPRGHGVTARLTLAAGVAIALVASGCAADRVPIGPRTRPSATSGSVPAPGRTTVAPDHCTGAGGKSVIQALMRDLSDGKRIVLSEYFVDPVDFVRWADPGAYVTLLPDGDGNVTLDALQSRLDDLEKAHATMEITAFTDLGYFAGDAGEHGGSFSFTLRGRGSAQSAISIGSGSGVIDCTSQKIQSLFLYGW
jgi:hypothetical protein